MVSRNFLKFKGTIFGNFRKEKKEKGGRRGKSEEGGFEPSLSCRRKAVWL